MPGARVFLTDFGLARWGTGQLGLSPPGARLTRTGETPGTPAYMSPEQARGDAALTPASDVWGLGCVGYELLAGKPPFQGATPAEIVGAILSGPPPRLGFGRTAGAGDAERLVWACLAPDPARRPPDAAQVRRLCAQISAGGRVALRRRRRGAGVAVAAALASVAAVGAWGLARGGTGPAGPPPAPPVTSRAQSLADRGWALRTGNPAAASAALQEALALEPGRHEWRVLLGLLCWALGRSDDARATWAEVPRHSPQWSEARLYRGLESCFRLEQGRFRTTAGLEDLRPVADTPGEAGALARAAVAIFQDEQWDVARGLLEGRTDWLAALLRASVESQAPGGDAVRARRDWDAALAGGIEFPWLYYYRGRWRAQHEDAAGAIADYDRALMLWPDYQFALANRGALHVQAGRRDPAIADLRRAVALDREDHLAWEWLGIAWKQAGDARAAVEALTEAVRTKPDCDVARLQRASAWEMLADLARAEADLTAILERSPGHLDARRGRAAIRGATRDWRGAFEDLTAAIGEAPADLALRSARGVVALERLRDPATALADFGLCVELAPEDPGHRFNRGLAHWLGGDPARALEDFEAAAAMHRRELAANPAAENAAERRRWLADCEARAAAARARLAGGARAGD